MGRAVLASLILKEELGVLGKLGCAICLMGSVIIILHAPADKEVTTVDEILDYAVRPGFLIYCIVVAFFATFMIFIVSPKYGKKNPMVYISICSTVGSISVMAIKGFGIAVKLTIQGNNQFTHFSTYVFATIVTVCIAVQLNYLNKALDQYDISIVNPLYYVTFTTFTLCASFILFAGINTSNAVNNISLICGFLIIFTGVYILNVSRGDVSRLLPDTLNGVPMDNTLAGVQTRRSFQAHRNSFGRPRSSSLRSQDMILVDELDAESLGLGKLDGYERQLDSDDEFFNAERSSERLIKGHRASSIRRVV